MKKSYVDGRLQDVKIWVVKKSVPVCVRLWTNWKHLVRLFEAIEVVPFHGRVTVLNREF